MVYRISILSIILLISTSTLRAQYGVEPVTATDLLQIRQPGSVDLSPDGKQLIYTLRNITDDEDNKGGYRYDTQLFLVGADGTSEPRQLTYNKESATQPAWSPDGTTVAFRRTVDGKPQIFLLSLSGGEARQLTDYEYGADSPVWSPDGSHVLFTTSVDYHQIAGDEALSAGAHDWDYEKPVLGTPYSPGDVNADPDGDLAQIRAWLRKNEDSKNPRIINRLNFLSETGLQPDISFSHLLTIAADGTGKPVHVTNGYQSYSGGNWSPDGNTIIFQGPADDTIHPDRVTRSKLFASEHNKSTPEVLLDLPDYSLFSPVYSPDGRHIAFLASDRTDRGYAQTMIGILDTRDGSHRFISENLDRSAGNIKWSGNSRFIYFTAPANGGFPLFRYDVRTGEHRQLSSHDTGIRDYDISGNRMAWVQSEVANPFELYAGRDDMSRSTRLSSHNSGWLNDKRLSFPERHTLTTSDGFEIEYWIMKPAFFEEGGSYPLLLQIHGGPSAMWGPGEASMWHEFQLFTAMGYGIVYANPRGSGGYGRDFQHGNHNDWGFGPMNDVLAAAERAAEEPWADADRMVVTGGSYGGYLVAWIVAHDHRFRAAAAQRGVYELTTFMGEGNAWRLIPDRFGGYPWEPEVRTVLDRESPYTWVDRIDTPLLILHGDVDLRTGVSQSEMLYKSLKILEKPVEFVRYPDASHELSRSGNVVHRLDRLLRMAEFFDRYINN
ncbi:MAG: prolyl oligopeptidase family serine peptidase [Cyclonatronaceae bacterium]